MDLRMLQDTLAVLNNFAHSPILFNVSRVKRTRNILCNFIHFPIVITILETKHAVSVAVLSYIIYFSEKATKFLGY